MKKILAVLSVLGIATLLTGCNNMKVDNFQKNIQDFKEHVSAYTNVNNIQTTQTKVGKYLLSSSLNEGETDIKPSLPDKTSQTKDELINKETDNDPIENEQKDEPSIVKPTNEMTAETEVPIQQMDVNGQDEKLNEVEPKDTQISTLYSLSSDVDDCCEDFVTLKQNITNAILETQNLIDKVNKKEIELTNEQKMLITEQSSQLKDLGRQLARSTTELSISLSDLNNLMLNNGDLNTLSLKYLIVLDNLVNGNEMLENGLHSLNMINNLFNMDTTLPPNNRGRILYGFKHNNEEPIIKDYLIDNEGNIKENTNDSENIEPSEESQENNNLTEETNVEVKKEKSKIKNIDTMQNNQKMNIDSYNNNNRHNVDSFFNTALLDNEFMYGNGYGPMANGGIMYGYGNNGYNQPYNENATANNGQYNEGANTNRSVLNNNNTQNKEQNVGRAKNKKFKISKNVDSYKDVNTPTLTTRFGKIKNAVSGFFNKFHKKDKANPIYRFNPNDDEING